MRDELRLLEELEEAAEANIHARDCQVCRAMASMSEEARSFVKSSLTGTIGINKLAAILTRNGYPTGRRAIDRHRSEGHS